MNTNQLYSDMVLDHARQPRHHHIPDSFTHHVLCHNPSCGDKLVFYASATPTHLEHLHWQGTGCALCMASASLWVDWWHRTQPNLTNLEDTLLVGKSFLTAPHQSPPFPKYETLTSIHRYPSRVKCAALAVEGLLQLGRDIQKS